MEEATETVTEGAAEASATPESIVGGLMKSAMPWDPMEDVAPEEPQEQGGGTTAEEADDTPEAEKPATTEAGAEHPLRSFLAGDAVPDKPVTVPKTVSEWLAKHGVNDPAEILTELPKLRNTVKELTANVEKQKADLGVFDKLSEEAKNVIRMDLDGEDWKKKVLSRPSLDYSKDFDKQDKKTMLDLYGGGKVSDEDLEEYLDDDGDPKTKAFVEAVLDKASILYNKDKEDVTTYGAKRTAEIARVQEASKKSYQASLEHVFKQVPGSQAYKEEIEEAAKGLNDHFFEKDGVTWKPTALLDAWMLKKFPELLQARTGKAKTEARNEADLDLLRRTPEKRASMATKSGGADGGKTPQDIADELTRNALNFPGSR